MENKVRLFNIQHFSLNDGPGIRTVIFFKGCPLNCVWCHNPESNAFNMELSFTQEKCILCGKCMGTCMNSVHSVKNAAHYIDREKCLCCGKCVEGCPFSALKIFGKDNTIDEIMEDIAKDDVFFADGGGVTFSGGEPFMQFDALYELLIRCKKKGYSTCIETSGFAKTENIIKAAKYTDIFLFDCKETNKENHEKYVGVDNSLILANLSALNDVDAHVILRCPIIPGVNDRKEHFLAIAELANKFISVKSVEFMPYHPLGISKFEQIGKKSLFNNKDFMDKNMIKCYCDEMRKITDIPIKIN